MSVLKVVEIMSDSTKSWEDATEKGIKRASKTVKNIKSAYVQEQSVTVSDNNVKSYRVNLKVSFGVDD
jgi:flavin-binding protein dodecin